MGLSSVFVCARGRERVIGGVMVMVSPCVSGGLEADPAA